MDRFITSEQPRAIPMFRHLTPRRVALLWLWLLTSCATGLTPRPPPVGEPSQLKCAEWKAADAAWDVVDAHLRHIIEAGRVAACPVPVAPLAPPSK